jgi:hypothetical protein
MQYRPTDKWKLLHLIHQANGKWDKNRSLKGWSHSRGDEWVGCPEQWETHSQDAASGAAEVGKEEVLKDFQMSLKRAESIETPTLSLIFSSFPLLLYYSRHAFHQVEWNQPSKDLFFCLTFHHCHLTNRSTTTYQPMEVYSTYWQGSLGNHFTLKMETV